MKIKGTYYLEYYWNIRTTLIFHVMLQHQEGTHTSFLQNIAQIQDSRCHVSSMDLLILLNFSEMKIQRLAANSTDSLVFYVNDTTQQSQKDCVGIELPSEALKGKS